MANIVTKKGDKGKTSLYSKDRVYKDDLRIEACGILDELVSFLGLAKSVLRHKKVKDIIQDVQKELLFIGTEFVSNKRIGKQSYKKIGKANVKNLDTYISCLQEDTSLKINSFILPGKTPSSALLDVVRSIARKLERRAVTLSRKQKLNNKDILTYLNRLSDLFYLLARIEEKNKPR